MGLLDGEIEAIFAQAFGPIYLDATLHRQKVNYDGAGGGVVGWTDEPVKGQLDVATWAMQRAEGYVDGDQRILVLKHGVDPITTDDEITIRDIRWQIASVSIDPALSYYDLHGRRRK